MRDFFYGPIGAVRFGFIVAALMLALVGLSLARGEETRIEMPAESHEVLFPLKDAVNAEQLQIERETGIPSEVVFRVLASESSMIPGVVHPVNPDGSRDIGWSGASGTYLSYYRDEFMGGRFRPRNFSDSYKFTSRYLSRLRDEHGGITVSVVAYKIGPARIAEAPARLWKLARYVVRGS